MPVIHKRDALVLSQEQIERLQTVRSSGNESPCTVVRAGILLRYGRGEAISEIARQEGVSRPTVQLCLDKALSGGIETAIRDLSRTGRPSMVTAEDKAWVMHLACSKPTEHGYKSEVWTLSQLTAHVRKHAKETGHLSLESAQKYIIRTIIKESALSPHNVTYYSDKRELINGERVASLFAVAKDVELLLEVNAKGNIRETKLPDSRPKRSKVQASTDITADLASEPNSHPFWFKDYDRDRLGTFSLHAGIDLCDGRVTAMVCEKNRKKGFVDFLEVADDHYPPDWRIRILLGDGSTDVSKQNVKMLRGYPNRFEFVHVQGDESWLNLVDVCFTTMTRGFLRSIRAKSKAEFINRIDDYVGEINLLPAVVR